MTHEDHFTREAQLAHHLDRIAAQAVPDTLDGWPSVHDRICSRIRARRAARARRGALTLALALIGVVLGGVLLAARPDGGARFASSLPDAASRQENPTATPLPPTATPPTPPPPLPWDGTPLEVAVSAQRSGYLALTAESGEQVRLNVAVVEPPGEPAGVTVLHNDLPLLTFDVSQFTRLAVEFDVPAGGEDLLMIRADGTAFPGGAVTLRLTLDHLGRSAAAGALPAGRVALALPLDRLPTSSGNFQPGDRVDVIAAFLFVDLGAGEIDSRFQNALPSTGEVAVFEYGTAAALATLQPGAEPRLVMQRLVGNAQVIAIGPLPVVDSSGEAGAVTTTPETVGPDLITLAVTAEEAMVLSWALEAQVPLMLVPAAGA